MSLNRFFLDKTPGSLSKIDDIKILICSILAKFDSPVSKEYLNDSLQFNETVNYFNFCFVLSQMIKDNLVEEFEKNKTVMLRLTNAGFEVADALKGSVPAFLIDKNVEKIKSIIKYEKDKQGKKTVIKEVEDGYTAEMNIEDTGANLMELKLYVPDFKRAEKFTTEFNKKAVDLYRCIVSILCNDSDLLETIITDMKKYKQ